MNAPGKWTPRAAFAKIGGSGIRCLMGVAGVSVLIDTGAAAGDIDPGRRTQPQPRSTRRPVLIAAGTVSAAVLVLAGCSSSGPPAPTQVSGYSVVCAGSGGGTPVPEAAAFSGPGPHPIAFFDGPAAEGVDDGTLTGTDTASDEVPDSWYTTDVDKVQLVACINPTKAAHTKDCGAYSQSGLAVPGSVGIDVMVQSQIYTISLYAAKTGKLVTKPIALVGASDASCPETVSELSATGPYIEDTDLTAAQVKQALGKYVT